MAKSKLPNLGRSLTKKDRMFRNWALKELSIDKHSGFGYKGLVKSGEIKPRPYHTNWEIQKRLNYTIMPYIPKKLFAHWLDNKNPYYFYSTINTGKLVVNIDCDNKFDLPSGNKYSLFWETTFSLLKAIGIEKAYTQKSTNGLGTHSYFTLTFDPPEQNKSNYFEWPSAATAISIRQAISDFQSAVRLYIKTNSIKLHVDILGNPAIYKPDGSIFKRGSWVKLPFGMDQSDERKRLKKRQSVSLEELRIITKNLLAKCNAISLENEIISHQSIKSFKPSTETKCRWDLSQGFMQFFEKYFGANQIPFYIRSLLTKEEFSDYLVAIETGSRISQSSKPKNAIWKNTLPVNLIRSIFQKSKECGLSSSSREFDNRKFRFIWSLLVGFDLVTVLNPKHSFCNSSSIEEGIIGIARKWFVNDKFFGFFASSTFKKTVTNKEFQYEKTGTNTKALSSIITGNTFLKLLSLVVAIWIFLAGQLWATLPRINKKPKYHLLR